MQLPDPLTLEGHSILMNNNGEQLSQSTISTSINDTMSPITFQQDANGKLESVNVQISSDNTTGNIKANILIIIIKVLKKVFCFSR
jgi:hypothetical protein